MKKNKKYITLAIIAIVIASFAFGYAYLTTTLTINGITDIDRNSWDVYFDNVQVTDGSVSGVQEIEAPTITSDTEVEFHVNLKKPGDFYEFTIEARNDGTIDAMINSISKKLNNVEVTTLPAYLNYTVTYEDGIEIQNNHLLAAESLETYKIRVEFKKNISSSDLPSTAQSLSLSFGVEYVQADENTETVRTYLYTLDSRSVRIGNPISENIITFTTPTDAMDSNNTAFYLKHVLSNNVVLRTYFEYIYNDEIYSLRGGGATYNSNTNSYNNDSIYYESNKSTLLSSLGIDSCVENNYGSGKKLACNNPITEDYIRVYTTGEIEIDSINDVTCRIYPDGESNCATF